VKGRAIAYSADELAWIEEHSAFARRDLHRFFVMFFGRTDVTVDALKALCLRKGWKTGRDGRLQKGSIPANKGKKMPFNAASARTQFKKGQRPHTYKGPGHEFVDNKDGYVWLIVEDGVRYPSCPNRSTRPVLKHRWLWEQANGPVPPKHVLKCLDGDKQNCSPTNWLLVPSSSRRCSPPRCSPTPRGKKAARSSAADAAKVRPKQHERHLTRGGD
jgi:hypothetical protein